MHQSRDHEQRAFDLEAAIERNPISALKALLVAIGILIGGALCGAPIGYLAGKTAEGVSAYGVLALGALVFSVALVGAWRLARRATRGWRIAIAAYVLIAGLSGFGASSIGMLKRSDLGRCPGGFVQCLWGESKDIAKDIADEL